MFQMLENLTSRLNRLPATSDLSTRAPSSNGAPLSMDQLEAQFFAQQTSFAQEPSFAQKPIFAQNPA